MQTVYIETTIPSYLAAHLSSQEPMATHQRMTRDWWEQERHRFLLYSSAFVRQEAARGDVHAAGRRLLYLSPIPELDVPDELDQLEADLIKLFQLPPKSRHRCFTFRNGNAPQDGLSFDLELHASRECHTAERSSRILPVSRISFSHRLHT